MKCLASPVRSEAYSQLRALGSATSKEIALQMGRSPETIHYHLRALLAAGLIREISRKPSPRKPEFMFAPVHDRVRLPSRSASPEIGELSRKLIEAGFRQSLRGFSVAAKGAEDQISAIRLNVRLEPHDLATFQAMIEEAVSYAHERRSPEGKQVHFASLLY